MPKKKKKKKKIGSVSIKRKGPTILTFAELYRWVVWQYPRQFGKGLCGAVCSSEPEEGWYPALIYLKDKVVHVYGHLDQKFSTPEEAADWAAENAKKS